MPRLKIPKESYFAGDPETRFGSNAMGEKESDYYSALEKLMPGPLAETPLYQERQWQPEDPAKVRAFLVEAAPFSNPKLSPGFWEHVLLASLHARVIAESIESPELSPDEAEGLNLIHDLGRHFSPEQYYRNEILNDLFVKRNGIRTEEFAKLPNNSAILGLRGKKIESFHDHTIAQRVMHVADWLGKRNESGELVKPEEIIKNSNASFEDYKKRSQWLSTYVGIRELEKGKVELGNQLFIDEVAWLQDEMGVDFEAVRKRVLEAFDNPEIQKWLCDVRNAQETISSEVNEQLNRPSIEHVIFDAGGVLLENSQHAFCEALSKRCGVPVDTIIGELAKLDLPELMSGEVEASVYLPEFFSNIGINGWNNEQMLMAFQYDDIHRPIPGMQVIVRTLSQNPDVKLSILSDSISAVIPPMVRKLKEYYPQFTEVLVSADIGASKRDPNGSAFKYALEYLGIEDPRTAVFIDDRETYTAAARTAFGMHGLTFRGNPYRDVTDTDRLWQEFKAAGLIK